MLKVIRFIVAALGAVLLVKLTKGLLAGEISYGIGGELIYEQVKTQSLAEAWAIWLAFGSLFTGLIVLGVKPRLFVERSWVWKLLLTAMLAGYGAAEVLRLRPSASPSGALDAGLLITALSLAALLGGLWLMFKPLRIGFASRDWPDAAGTVIESGAVSSGTNDSGERIFCVRVVYRYRVAGREYQGDRVSTLPAAFGEERIRQMVESYPLGSEVSVFYDPAEPATAVLEPGISGGMQACLIVYIAVCATLAAKIIVSL